MTHFLTLPFTVRRSDSVVEFLEVVSTNERVNGLLILTSDGLSVQWRTVRETQRVGLDVKKDHEVEPVREVTIARRVLAGAAVRWSWRWPPGRYLVLTGVDLHAFEQLSECPGIYLSHPAELLFRIPRSHSLVAREFASEVELGIADRMIEGVPSRAWLPQSPYDEANPGSRQ